jgi:hypothetical protein
MGADIKLNQGTSAKAMASDRDIMRGGVDQRAWVGGDEAAYAGGEGV